MRAYWIPLVVAEQAWLVSGDAAVVGHDVYVGPGRHILGWLWKLFGKPTIVC